MGEIAGWTDQRVQVQLQSEDNDPIRELCARRVRDQRLDRDAAKELAEKFPRDEEASKASPWNWNLDECKKLLGIMQRKLLSRDGRAEVAEGKIAVAEIAAREANIRYNSMADQINGKDQQIEVMKAHLQIAFNKLEAFQKDEARPKRERASIAKIIEELRELTGRNFEPAEVKLGSAVADAITPQSPRPKRRKARR